LHLLLDRVLVERHRHAAQRLRGQHRPVELGAVVADHRGLVPAREAERGEPQRDQPRLLDVLAPGVRLPDPEILFTDGDLRRKALSVAEGQLREGVESRLEHHRWRTVVRVTRERVKGSAPTPLEEVSTLVRPELDSWEAPTGG